MADVWEVLYWAEVQEECLSGGGGVEEVHNHHGDVVHLEMQYHWQALGSLHQDQQCNQAAAAVAVVEGAVAAAVVLAAVVAVVAVVVAAVAAAAVADVAVAGDPAAAWVHGCCIQIAWGAERQPDDQSPELCWRRWSRDDQSHPWWEQREDWLQGEDDLEVGLPLRVVVVQRSRIHLLTLPPTA